MSTRLKHSLEEDNRLLKYTATGKEVPCSEYKIILKMPIVDDYYHKSSSGGAVKENLRTGVVIDTETTSLDGEIIQLGVLLFEYNPETWQIGRTKSYEGLEQTTAPISAEAQK